MVQPCVDFLRRHVQPTIQQFCTHIEGLDQPKSALDTLSRHGSLFIERHVPRSVVLVSEAVLKSIHYIALTVLLPAPLRLATIGIISACKIALPENRNCDNLLNGVGFGCVINAAKSILFLDFIAGAVNLIAAALLFSASPIATAFSQALSEEPKVPPPPSQQKQTPPEDAEKTASVD